MPLDVSSPSVEQLMCVVVLVKLNAVGDAVRHLHVAEAFFARTNAINFFVYVQICAGASVSTHQARSGHELDVNGTHNARSV